MSRCTGVKGKQTELEFAYSLWSRNGNECRGPLVRLRLQGIAYEGIVAALDCVGVTDVLHAAAVKELSDKGGSFQMCACHWVDVMTVVGGMGEAHKNPVWTTLKTSLFVMVSKAADWDWRELDNRFTSFHQAKLAGK